MIGEPPVKRDDGRMEAGKNERAFYGRIIGRAQRVRDRAAESLNCPAHLVRSGENGLTPLEGGERLGGRSDAASGMARDHASHTHASSRGSSGRRQANVS